MSAIWVGPVLAGLITGLAAVGAVYLTQRGVRRQAHDDRLWQRRADSYSELLQWANEVNVWSLGRQASDPTTKPSMVERDLYARLSTIAGPEVTRWLEEAEWELQRTGLEALPAPQLHVKVEALIDAVRQELLRGHVRGRREQRRIGIGHRSLRNIGLGGGPRPR